MLLLRSVYLLFIAIVFENIFIQDLIIADENENNKTFYSESEILKNDNKVKSFFKSFFQNYVFTEKNQIFRDNKYGIFFTYGVSVDKDKRSGLTGDSFYDYDTESKISSQHFWNGGYKYRAVGASSMHYSTPNKIMDINGRMSLGFMSWHGLNDEYKNRFGAFGIEFIQEFIFGDPVLYVTAGIGPSYVFPFKHYNRHTNMASQFFFAIVANVGHRFKNGMTVEVGFKHYSNGELRSPNYGLNVVNMTIGYTFN